MNAAPPPADSPPVRSLLPSPTETRAANKVAGAASGKVASVLDSAGFTRAQFWILILILAGEFFDTLEQNSVGAMSTHIKDSLNIGDGRLTTINTFTVIGGLVGRVLAGWFADRYGRRFSLSLNLLIYTLGGLLSAIAIDYNMLLISRFIVGVGVGGEFMIGIAMLSEMVATKHRGGLTSTINVGAGGVGNFISYGFFLLMLGPLQGVLGGPGHAWRWTFAVLAIPALCVVFFRRLLPETPRFLLTQGRVAAANRSLGVIVSNSLRTKDALPPVLLTYADCPKEKPNVSPWEIFRSGVIRRTAAIGVCSWMAFGSQVTLNFLMPTLLVERGYTVSKSLLFTMIMNVGSLLGALVAALIANRVGRRVVVSTAGVLGCVTALTFAIFGNSTPMILIIGATFQFFAMLTNTTLAAWTPEVFPTAIRASGSSIVNGVGNVAGAVIPYLAIALYHGAGGFAGVFGLAAVMYGLLVVASRFAPETRGKTLESVNEQDGSIMT